MSLKTTFLTNSIPNIKNSQDKTISSHRVVLRLIRMPMTVSFDIKHWKHSLIYLSFSTTVLIDPWKNFGKQVVFPSIVLTFTKFHSTQICLWKSIQFVYTLKNDFFIVCQTSFLIHKIYILCGWRCGHINWNVCHHQDWKPESEWHYLLLLLLNW